MSKRRKEQAELQKSREEILRMRSDNAKTETRKFAWEYDLEIHRRQQSLNRYHSFGATCGILALVLVIVLNWSQLVRIVTAF